MTNSSIAQNEVLARSVFERVKDELLAVPNEKLLAITLDCADAARTVLGALPKLKALRPEIAKELPGFDLARFDKLEDFAIALEYTHAVYLGSALPADERDKRVAEATSVRERLLAEARLLVLHGVLSADQLDDLKGAKGFGNVATDVMVLADLLDKALPRIEGKTLSTKESLEEAMRLSTRLSRLLGAEDMAPEQEREAATFRQRAFTCLFKAYEDVRRAAAYLRAEEGDADKLAPGLHKGRPRRRPRAEADTPAAAPSETDVTASSGAAEADVDDDGPFMS